MSGRGQGSSIARTSAPRPTRYGGLRARPGRSVLRRTCQRSRLGCGSGERSASPTHLRFDAHRRHRTAADLVCDGPGLILGVGVKLDLRGHTLRGTSGGTGLAVLGTGTETIKNGTLTGWDSAVRTVVIFDGPGPGPLLVDRVWFKDNRVGIDGVGDFGVGAKDMTLTRSKFTNSRVAAITAELNSVSIDRTTFADNTVGYWGDTGSGATITGTRFVRNARAVIATEASVTVERSTFVDNPKAVVSLGVISGLTPHGQSVHGLRRGCGRRRRVVGDEWVDVRRQHDRGACRAVRGHGQLEHVPREPDDDHGGWRPRERRRRAGQHVPPQRRRPRSSTPPTRR